MAAPQDKPGASPVDPRWEQTIKSVHDPGESIHIRPSATPDDVERLGKTLKTTSFLGAGQEEMSRPVAGATRAPDGVLGRDFFAFQAVLGQGGMGLVYNGIQQSMSREVAVKTLREEALRDTDTAAAFMREALTTGALSHPNIVPVHFFGRDDKGQPFMVMKRVQGRPWNDLLAEAGAKAAQKPDEFDLRLQLEIFLKVCDAVAFAHAHHIVHRDLKPGNVMIGDFGEVMVMDWGLAFDVSPGGDRGLATPRAQASPIAGTPAYMAPEMVRGDVNLLGPATDIYLLGGILYEIVTGLPPHFGPDVYAVLAHVANGRIDRLQARPSLTREARQLERIILTALAVKPAERYPDVAALEAEVRAFLAGQGDRRDSEALTQSARDDLTALAREVEDLLVTSPYYPRCTEIVAKAQQALTLWGFNSRAVRVRQEALALFADLAVRGKDWGLAESLLRDLKLSGSGGHKLAGPIELRLRAQREKMRLRDFLVQRMARMAAVATVFMAALSIYLYWHLRSVEDAMLALEASRGEGPSSPAPPPEPEPGTVTFVPVRPTGVGPADPAPRPVPGPAAVQVVRPQREFAPQAMEPWRLPRDRDDPTPRPEDAPPLKRFLASPTGNVLVWDDEGCAWVWNTALPPSSTRHLGLAKSRGVLAAAWIDGRTVLLAVADGELLTTELPAMPRDLMRPWQTILKADTTVRALAARLQGMDLLLAVGTDKNIRIIVPGKDVLVEPVTAPVLCLQYLTNGTLIATTQTAIRVWLPNGQETSFALNEPCAVAVSAWVAPCVAVVPAGRKDEIQILNLDLDANKGGCTTASRLCEGEVVCLALSADGKLLIAGSKAGELVLMNGAPWKVVAKAKPHTGAVRAVEFNHDGAKVYSADNSGQIYVWNIAGQKP